MQFFAQIVNGKAQFDNRGAMVEYIASLESKIVKFEINPVKRTRSNAQNRFYWGVVVSLINEELNNLGNDTDLETTHEFLKHRFLTNKKNMLLDGGELFEFDAASTTKLSVSEFSEYIEKCMQFGIEFLNITFPEKSF